MKTKENIDIESSITVKKSFISIMKDFTILGLVAVYICGVEYIRSVTTHINKK